MVTIVRGAVDPDEFALEHTLRALDGIEVECERIIRSGDDAVMPLLWFRYGNREAIEEALAEDPTVRDVTWLAQFDEEYLCRMEWIDRVRLLLQMLTNAEATILDAFGRRDRWQLRVLYPERELFAKTHEFCDEHGLSFDVASIRELEGEPAGRYGLTEEQFEALAHAAREGYFEVPRAVQLEELADHHGISHQALSERIRRATGALVEDALLVGARDDGDE